MIKVENLTKEFILRHRTHDNYVTLRDSVSNLFKKGNRPTREKFLALDDVSFEIGKGERVGVIGRNGAGKSTLLKVISRIVTPTKGRISIEGRVASLLEVGTGFHGELSGRENIFLNGAILGMSKSEIQKNFDAIVDFAGVERFLDTPVKRYSSGMYVRLAFSVAAHLEPEILIVDEVLAVGDAEFQKKCIGKMKEVSTSDGRTILFVSHNVAAVRSMCDKAIYLENGRLKAYDNTESVLSIYQGNINTGAVDGIQIQATPLSESKEWEIGSDIEISITWEKHRFAPGWHCDISCFTLEGVKVFGLQSSKFPGFNSEDPALNGVIFKVRNIGLAPGDLRLHFAMGTAPQSPYFLVIENCLTLSPSDKFKPEYQHDDVITIPLATCHAITK